MRGKPPRKEPDLPGEFWVVFWLAIVCALMYHFGIVEQPPMITDQDAIRAREE